MVVLAGLVGAGGLRAGLSIVAVALLLDRLTRAALQGKGRR